jgi:hypothetical protein
MVERSVNTIPFLAVDAVEMDNSDHPGLPMHDGRRGDGRAAPPRRIPRCHGELQISCDLICTQCV